ncbi:MAG: hypothetical protein ABJB76_05590 [Candidatus Nitrosocosmicus sp.]
MRKEKEWEGKIRKERFKINSCFYEWFEQSIVDAKYAIEGAKLQKALIL